jgi:stage II sporulation protein D
MPNCFRNTFITPVYSLKKYNRKELIKIQGFIFILFFFNTLNTRAQKIKISLFNEVPLQTVVIGVAGNSYSLLCDSLEIDRPSNDDAYYISLIDNNLTIRNKQKPLGTFHQIQLVPLKSNVFFTVTPVSPKKASRQYDDGITVSVAFKRISLINDISENNYIAGVVEAEAGINATSEFYKAQSILARTYIYGHRSKHISEGFNLCDGVHCQAYKGRATKNPVISKATLSTNGLVAVDSDSSYIIAAFHANCGGFTESSQNAWLSIKNYLVSVKDPFCQNSPAARWEKTISVEDWRNYLKNHNFKNATKIAYIDFNVVNTERNQFYRIKNDSLPYKQIRTDFELKSSFFSISATASNLTFQGRGYGHGVGMCQEGAMQMSKIGYKYDEILTYYFKGINIIKQ